jgi:hypothetical protein
MLRYPIFFILIFSTFFSTTLIAQGDYLVVLNEKNATIGVQACFETVPDRLITGKRNSHTYLQWIKQGDKILSPSSRAVKLSPNHSKCVNYQVNLTLMLKDRQAWNDGDNWMVNNRSWLWQPDNTSGIELRFRFENPNDKLAYSVPWPEKNGRYQGAKSPSRWTSRMAFGSIYREDLTINDQTLRLAIVGISSPEKRKEIAQWVQHTATTVAQVGGNFPVDNAQTLVLPRKSRRGSSPVPWGEVQRNGLPAVHLFVNTDLPMSEFYADWTATHEFSHLLIPKVDYKDRWISEGLATYYQYIVMARSGVISQQNAWQKIRAGLEKGQRASLHRPLRQSNKTKHTYWGGAGIFLLADLGLREKNKSLDEVLSQLDDCCMPSHKNWSALEFMTKLDQLSQTKIFTELLNNQAQASQFPIDQSIIDRRFNQLDQKMKGLFKHL